MKAHEDRPLPGADAPGPDSTQASSGQKKSLISRFGRGAWNFSDWFLPLSPLAKIARQSARIGSLIGQFAGAVIKRSRIDEVIGEAHGDPTAEAQSSDHTTPSSSSARTKPAPSWMIDCLIGLGIAMLVISCLGAGLGVGLGGIVMLSVGVQQTLLRSRKTN